MSTASNMTLIQTQTVGSGGAASIDFTGITQTGYTDLQLVVNARVSGNYGEPYAVFDLTFNGLSTNRSQRTLYGQGTGPISASYSAIYAWNASSSATANTFSNINIYIPNYTSSANKSVSIDGVTENNGTNAFQYINAGLWSSTAAITRITLTDTNGYNFVEGSTASLYGIKSAGKVAKATGGNIFVSGSYIYHMFTASGTFTPTQNLTNVDYLVIAGGGGGGWNTGGGGGAGGYRCTVTGESSGGGGSAESKLSLTSGTGYTVTIGAGGAAGTSNTIKGSTGSNSVFSTITSSGGGGGGSAFNTTGVSGGSGGGGAGNDTAGQDRSGGAGTSLQGYAGGTGNPNGSNYGGAGGGGAGSVGANGTSSVSGDGGSGVTSSITGSSVARAGGGGGGGYTDPSLGNAGGGNGGSGGSGGTSGTANTGGGGGGGDGGGGVIGGAGGSGIVIVRYAA